MASNSIEIFSEKKKKHTHTQKRRKNSNNDETGWAQYGNPPKKEKEKNLVPTRRQDHGGFTKKNIINFF